MAVVTLATLRDYWKKVSDWVDGVYEPKVKVSGHTVSDTQPIPVSISGYDPVQDALRTAKGFLFEELAFNVSIGPGQEFSVFAPIEGFTRVFVQAYGKGIFDVYSQPSPDGSFVMDREPLAQAVAANAGVCKPINNLAPYVRLTIKNTSALTAKYHLWVYGV